MAEENLLFEQFQKDMNALAKKVVKVLTKYHEDINHLTHFTMCKFKVIMVQNLR